MAENSQKTLIILLRGLGREAGHWFAFPQQLKKTFPFAETLCIDLPGCGVWHRETSPTRITDLTNKLHEEFSQLQIETHFQQIILVGMSLGGMIAVDWLQRFPGIFSGAVLINSSLRGFGPLWHRMTPTAFAYGLSAMGGSLAVREKVFLNLSCNDHSTSQLYLPKWQALQAEHPVSNSTILRQLFAASNFRPLTPKPNAPMLLLASAGDRIVSAQCSQAIHRAWDIPIAIHPTAGHDLCLEQGDWVCDQLRKLWFSNI